MQESELKITAKPQDWRRLSSWAATIGMTVVMGLLIALFINRLRPLGHFIPSKHITQDYFVALVWGMGIGLLLTCFPVSLRERKDLVWLWAVRCSVTLFAMLFYEHHYPLDAYGYYEVSTAKMHSMTAVGFGRGTDNIEAFSWLVNHYLPVLDSFHALKVVYSFVGFLGSYFIYRGFCIFFGYSDRNLMMLIFLFPSMIFWSSILGKDPVNLFGIALYVYGALGLTKEGKLGYVLPIVLGTFIASWIRNWNLAILVLPLATLGIRGIKRPAMRVVFIATIIAAAVYSVRMFAAQFQVENAEELVSRTQSLSHSWNGGGSGRLAPTFSSPIAMLKFAPLGMFTALFRPLPGEVMNPFGLLAGFENLFLLGYIIKSVGKIWKNKVRRSQPQVVWCLALILVWSFMYSFVSFQNLGSATRFRLQVLPVMLSLIYYLTSDRPELLELENVRDRRAG